jgi:hypothetical protein
MLTIWILGGAAGVLAFALLIEELIDFIRDARARQSLHRESYAPKRECYQTDRVRGRGPDGTVTTRWVFYYSDDTIETVTKREPAHESQNCG